MVDTAVLLEGLLEFLVAFLPVGFAAVGLAVSLVGFAPAWMALPVMTGFARDETPGFAVD
jgi:hypothetical protein